MCGAGGGKGIDRPFPLVRMAHRTQCRRKHEVGAEDLGAPWLWLSDVLELQVLDLHLLPLTIGSESRDAKLHSERETGPVA